MPVHPGLMGQPSPHKKFEHDWSVFFAETFKEHEQRLHTLVIRLTRSDQYAKDVIQEVFLKLWEQRDNLHTIQNLEAWLYRLTENKVIDFLRKLSADKRMKEAVWNNMHMQQVNNVEASVSIKEFHHYIQQAIETLPPQRRLIYFLNREEGLNYQQIADELQISRHTVKNQLSSALQSIRTFLSRTTRFFTC